MVASRSLVIHYAVGPDRPFTFVSRILCCHVECFVSLFQSNSWCSICVEGGGPTRPEKWPRLVLALERGGHGRHKSQENNFENSLYVNCHYEDVDAIRALR